MTKQKWFKAFYSIRFYTYSYFQIYMESWKKKSYWSCLWKDPGTAGPVHSALLCKFHVAALLLPFLIVTMPHCCVSQDLKDWIPYLQYVEGFKVKEIERLLNIKKSMIYQILSYHQNYGVTYNPAAFSCFPHGQPHTLTNTDLSLIRSLLSQDPTLYLDELQDKLLMHCGVSISIPTLLWSLCHIHSSQKYVSIHALEHNDIDCSIYMNHFAKMVSDPAMVMFVDGAAKNKQIPSCKMGWSLKGRWCI